jgi:predicted  nucleic acid-binding Zn-ribbon protein
MTGNRITPNVRPVLPSTREACRARLAELQDAIAAIKTEIATRDLDRQARGGRIDSRWYHRAKTALRFKQQEVTALTSHMASLPSRRDALKDQLIAVLRADYDDLAWRAALDEARRRLGDGREAV